MGSNLDYCIIGPNSGGAYNAISYNAIIKV
jgi:hypothetical protein